MVAKSIAKNVLFIHKPTYYITGLVNTPESSFLEMWC